MRSIIKKSIALPKVKLLIRKANKLGLETTAFFVIGFPGENRKHLRNTFRFAENLNVDNVNFFFATPLPGTQLLDLCKENRLINGKLDYEKLKSNQPYFETGYLSKKTLMSLVYYEKLKLYFLSFLIHPMRFLRKLWHKATKDPRYFLRFGKNKVF